MSSIEERARELALDVWGSPDIRTAKFILKTLTAERAAALEEAAAVCDDIATSLMHLIELDEGSRLYGPITPEHRRATAELRGRHAEARACAAAIRALKDKP